MNKSIIYYYLGRVSRVVLPVDRVTGLIRGFAFVEMDNDAEADNAIFSLDGAEWMGSTLNVSEGTV